MSFEIAASKGSNPMAISTDNFTLFNFQKNSLPTSGGPRNGAGYVKPLFPAHMIKLQNSWIPILTIHAPRVRQILPKFFKVGLPETGLLRVTFFFCIVWHRDSISYSTPNLSTAVGTGVEPVSHFRNGTLAKCLVPQYDLPWRKVEVTLPEPTKTPQGFKPCLCLARHLPLGPFGACGRPQAVLVMIG